MRIMNQRPHRVASRGRTAPARRWLARAGVLAGLGVMLAHLGGCAIGALVGGMAESYRESSTREVKAEYTELKGKNVAVVVTADRMIQADHPGMVEEILGRFNQRIAENAIAGGFARTDQMLVYLANHPQWVAWPPGKLATELGVERLIYVEITEFRLHDPGNQYLWSGIAAGTVSVLEADGPLPDEFAFQKLVRVQFPDKEGYGQADLSERVVKSELLRRFMDRATWPFYDHEEPYYPDY
ncbi:MAG: hypothetical protein SFZ23_09655 [Planctomycetota bacterium]|nr:hypothetical protein [Planctomycetota bacterium]